MFGERIREGLDNPETEWLAHRARYRYLVPVTHSSGKASLHDSKPVDAPEAAVEDVRAQDTQAETEQLTREYWWMVGGVTFIGVAGIAWLVSR